MYVPPSVLIEVRNFIRPDDVSDEIMTFFAGLVGEFMLGYMNRWDMPIQLHSVWANMTVDLCDNYRSESGKIDPATLINKATAVMEEGTMLQLGANAASLLLEKLRFKKDIYKRTMRAFKGVIPRGDPPADYMPSLPPPGLMELEGVK